MAACSPAPAEDDAQLVRAPVTASRNIDVAAFNRGLPASVDDGQAWAADPVQVAARLVGAGGARRAVWTIAGAGEHPDHYRVVVVTDGLTDDSVRGRRYEVALAATSQAGWHVERAQESWRCWRGGGDAFDIRPCP